MNMNVGMFKATTEKTWVMKQADLGYKMAAECGGFACQFDENRS